MRNLKFKANTNQCTQAQSPVLPRYIMLYFLFITVAYIIIWPISAFAQAQNTNEILIQKSSFATVKKDIAKLGALEKFYLDGRSAYNKGDTETASIIWRNIAELGHANAQYELASLMLNDSILEKDIKTALQFFRKAANQGHSKAQYNMGVAFAKGIGVKQDTGEAVVWWRTSALNGNTDAQFNLGLMYSNGYGVSKDMVVAARWWRQAATQGDAAAQFNLGMLYASGEGVGQSWKTAINLWKRSAEQGFTHAVRALEVLAKNKN